CYIPETEKQYYFAAADAAILSYNKDFLVAGSMLLEAVRFKLPAISSDNGDLGELVRKYDIGLVFHAENVASLSSTLLAFLDSSHSQREAMANNCERFCDDFSYNKWSHRCMKIFTDLCVHTSKEQTLKSLSDCKRRPCP
ncbi:glycosyltransferase, partial [bacterium]|nr:glycosyltransferase [bacterium]